MATAKLMSINKLCEGNDGEPYTFFIPSYQRGYRWEEEQILNLAKDLYEFVDKSKDDDDFYCLQPVIVKEKEDETGNPVLEVVDGQQRLTALWIFYTIRQGGNIGNKPGPRPKYSLKYENKKPFTDYLNNINTYISEKHRELKDKDKRERKYDIYSFIDDILKDMNVFAKESTEETTKNIDIDYFKKSITALDDKLIDWVNDTEKSIYDFDRIINRILEDEKKIQIIWYELGDDDDEIDTFVNINANKIPLTNAELIKANLLYKVEKDNKDNEDKDNTKGKLLADRVATQWEEIEKSLNNDKFWHFMMKDREEAQTRIDYLFEIYCAEESNNNNDKYHIFNRISQEFEREKGSAEELWNKIQEIHDALTDWYNDYDFYHLIGLLIEVSDKSSSEIISRLYKTYKGNAKAKFRKNLLEKIIKLYGNLQTKDKEKSSNEKFWFPKDISKENLEEFLLNLDYNDDREQIRKILLLYNIALLINGKNSYERFPFDLYDIQKWDIEHVYPQTPSDDATKDEYKTWLKGNKILLEDYIIKPESNGIEKSTLIEEINKRLSELNSEKALEYTLINTISKDLMKFLGNEDIEDVIDSIGNLVLLDNGTNRSYHNAQFIGKRNKIIKIERSIYEEDEGEEKNKRKKENSKSENTNNKFIPLGTKWVFLKGYENSKDLITWKRDDMNDYTDDIAKQIVKMFAGEEK